MRTLPTSGRAPPRSPPPSLSPSGLGVAETLSVPWPPHPARRHRAYFVDLFVRKSNAVAVDFYKKLGYVVYRTVLDYYSGENPEDAYGTRSPACWARRQQGATPKMRLVCVPPPTLPPHSSLRHAEIALTRPGQGNNAAPRQRRATMGAGKRLAARRGCRVEPPMAPRVPRRLVCREAHPRAPPLLGRHPLPQSEKVVIRL